MDADVSGSHDSSSDAMQDIVDCSFSSSEDLTCCIHLTRSKFDHKNRVPFCIFRVMKTARTPGRKWMLTSAARMTPQTPCKTKSAAPAAAADGKPIPLTRSTLSTTKLIGLETDLVHISSTSHQLVCFTAHVFVDSVALSLPWSLLGPESPLGPKLLMCTIQLD